MLMFKWGEVKSHFQLRSYWKLRAAKGGHVCMGNMNQTSRSCFVKRTLTQHIVFTNLFVYRWVTIIIKEKRAMNFGGRVGGAQAGWEKVRNNCILIKFNFKRTLSNMKDMSGYQQELKEGSRDEYDHQYTRYNIFKE